MTLMTKSEKYIEKNQRHTHIPAEHLYKNPTQNISNLNPSGIYSQNESFIHYPQINMTHYINKMKGKNYVII